MRIKLTGNYGKGFWDMKKSSTFAPSNFGSIAQLVQSTCLTSRGSQVRILLLPQKKSPGPSQGLFNFEQPKFT